MQWRHEVGGPWSSRRRSTFTELPVRARLSCLARHAAAAGVASPPARISGGDLTSCRGRANGRAMANGQPPEAGTLLTAALLLLALAFVGYWIYASAGNEPLVLAPWFLAAAVALIVVSIVINAVRARRRPRRP